MNRISPDNARLTEGGGPSNDAPGDMDRAAADLPVPPPPRTFGWLNGRGLWTFYSKEVSRFLKVYQQSLLAPVATSLLFLAIFTLALGDRAQPIPGISFAVFLAPGLVMMSMIQNAFANTSSSMVISKVQGNIVDILMPPLTPNELTIGYIAAGLTRGLMVGAITLGGMAVFVPLTVHNPAFILFHAAGASMMLAMLGLIGGIWAEKFDHISAVTNFVITPLAFLSGTFYSIQRLPEFWQAIAHFNPFFYLIDGFRFGFTGHADMNVWLGAGIILTIDVVLWIICLAVFRSGWKLKS